MSLASHLHNMKGAIIGGSLLIASASAGIVWLSIAAVGGIAAMLGPLWAQAIVGVILLAPLSVAVFLDSPLGRRRRDVVTAPASDNDEALATIAAVARKMVDTSPLTALSLAGLAGVMSTSYPSALSVIATVLKETDNLGQAAPTEPARSSDAGDDAKAVKTA